MAGRRAAREAMSREQWAEQIGTIDRTGDAPPRTAISTRRIVDAALAVIEVEGFEDLTMRRVAAALDTGPASLYAHVRSKSALDDLLIGELCSRVTLPDPDPARWQAQFTEVCAQVRDQFLRYPGVARAAMAAVPSSLEPLRVADAMLGILLAGGVSPQAAGWASDAAFLYVTAYCLEAGIAHQQSTDTDGHVIDRAEIAERLQMLPPGRFPHIAAHARELTSGQGHERFEFTLNLLLHGLDVS